MSYYLVDFENVKSRGMEGVELLTEEDTVCIFYSNNADSMTFDLHRKLNETKAHIIYHKVAVGTKNALDFQLATYLGYLICDQQKSERTQEYYIVTKDNGFYSLLVYWKAEGVPVRIIRNLMWGKDQEAVSGENTEALEILKEVPETTEIVELEDTSAEDFASAHSNEKKTVETEFEIWEATLPECIAPEAIEEDLREPIPETDTVTKIPQETDVSAETEIKKGAENPQKSANLKKAPVKKKNAAKKTEKKTAQRENAANAKAEKPEQTEEELTCAVEAVLKEKEIVPQVVKFIRQYKTKQGINNALNKEFKDTKRTSEIYSAIKPLIADKKGK